ncbi:MAG: GntR family transcriptional regulator [Amycolatopsis sp.]|jgi:DNA-binding GntR family transcriptional regulator|uniref:GntR family transcriptional regulator n=1 Tax=Amycolatopsis sp. TaxID=37632 RepID=UPI00260C272B|nr:GntR family transcriptional regulator [Amycolatopsis sp.]MCU1686272.1 GntR family transcriptional regulator [Amycolatopsis sp.]
MTAMTGDPGKRFALSALRKAVLDGDLVPGQRLVEPELAERFGVSRSAIRAALIDLATDDGIVERIPNKGARLRAISTDEAVAVVECRMALDGICAARAAVAANDEQILELSDLGRQTAQAVSDGEPLKYSDLNLQLYRRIRSISGQVVAERLLDRLQDQLVRFQFRLMLRPGKLQLWLPEQLAIIDAIARHEPDEAEAATRTHFRSIITALREVDEPSR